MKPTHFRCVIAIISLAPNADLQIRHDCTKIIEYFVNVFKIQSIERERLVLDLARKRGGGLVWSLTCQCRVASEWQTADGRSGKPGRRQARARAPLTSATARRRAAVLTTGLPIIILCTRTARNKRRRRRQRGAGGERSPQERLQAPSSGRAATTCAYSFRSADDRIETKPLR